MRHPERKINDMETIETLLKHKDLAALTLAEAVVRLAARPRKHEGLLPLPGLIGWEEAERLAAAAGARITTG